MQKTIANASSKQDLLMTSLTEFFQDNKNFSKMLSIVSSKSKISLRVLDWFVTNFAKKKNIVYDHKKNGQTFQFNVYLNYKSQLKAYSKKQFDPFCRRDRIAFVYDDTKELITTTGQMNFFRWAIENRVINYVKDNLSSIEEDMKKSIKHLYSKKNKTKVISGGTTDNLKRRKRRELSVSATKSLNKQRITITLDFD